MEKEFNLSEKIQEIKISGLTYLEFEDVREFIEKLKECDIKHRGYILIEEIDELAGEKLVEGGKE